MNRKKTLWILIVTQIVYVLFIPIWLFMSGMSVMMFDDPEAASSAVAWLIFIVIFMYPIGLLIVGWVRFARRRYTSSLIWNSIPLLWIVPLGGFLLVANFSSLI